MNFVADAETITGKVGNEMYRRNSEARSCNGCSAERAVSLTVEEQKTNLMSLAVLFHFLRAQHVSDINISIIRSLRLCC